MSVVEREEDGANDDDYGSSSIVIVQLSVEGKNNLKEPQERRDQLFSFTQKINERLDRCEKYFTEVQQLENEVHQLKNEAYQSKSEIHQLKELIQQQQEFIKYSWQFFPLPPPPPPPPPPLPRISLNNRHILITPR